MNQILDYNPIKNSDDNNNNYYGRNSGNKGNIIKIFAIILIIFAICLIGIGVFNRYKNNIEIDNEKNNKKEAIIETEQVEDKLKIVVTHDKKIVKMIYNWNTSAEKTIAVDSGKTFETTIEIPAGENTLNVKVIDEKGNETLITKTIISEEGIDIINPVIECEVTPEKKIKIIATDETELEFITYRWNDEEETTVKPKDTNPKKVEVEIDIKTGQNNLTVTAVDKNYNTESFQKSYEGLLQPNIQVVLSEDKSKLKITCTHENGLSKIEYTLNDKPYLANLENAPTKVEFEQALDEGNNVIILTVTSVDGTVSTFGGQCTYTKDTSGVTVE